MWFDLTDPILLVVAVALIDMEDRVLVQKRPYGKAMAGLWEFPGGKVEPGETPEFALAREIHEELGIAIAEKNLLPACFASEPLNGRHLVLMLYQCRSWSGIPVAREAAAIEWLPVGALRDLPMPPADGPLVAQLEQIVSRSLSSPSA